jgi:hypothetical protein
MARKECIVADEERVGVLSHESAKGIIELREVPIPRASRA